MGCKGLLLNDPYKRDRIDGVCMWISLVSLFILLDFCVLTWLNKPGSVLDKKASECVESGFWGVRVLGGV
jgi:hypothetical protein